MNGSTLHLVLTHKWFDLIASGVKKEEYRDIKKFWATRLMKNFDMTNPEFIDFSYIMFSRAYAKNRPQIIFENKGISIGTGNPEWGAEPGKNYFTIKLGAFVSRTDQ